MTKNTSLLLCFSVAILAACNNSSKDSGNKTDTTGKAMSQGTMDHNNMSGNVAVPELPAIPAGAKVFFKNLKNGADISSPFKIEMGVEVIRVDTAGPVVMGSGHHHLFVDAEDSLTSGTIVPKDAAHIHFGKGQTEYEISLSPGKHKLTLQFADGLHRVYGGKLSGTVTVNVKE